MIDDDDDEPEVTQFMAKMKARFIKDHMNCGATVEQAEQAYRDVMESESLIQLPTLEELDEWADTNPEIFLKSEAELDAEYDRERSQYLNMLREKYRT